MGNPADTEDYFADTREDSNEEGNSPLTFADRVEEVAKVMIKNDQNQWVMPNGEELSEEMKVAAIATKRFRDTQAAYTKDRQRIKALEAEKTVLKKTAVGNVKIELTAEQAEELDELKFSDPEAWRRKMNKYEQEALSKHENELEEEVKQVSASSLEEEEKARRKDVLTEFLSENKSDTFNAEYIANDIPPRITRKLENGEITFEDFLTECLEYSKKGKVVKQTEKTLGQASLSKSGGGSTPDKNAVKEDAIKSYEKETF